MFNTPHNALLCFVLHFWACRSAIFTSFLFFITSICLISLLGHGNHFSPILTVGSHVRSDGVWLICKQAFSNEWKPCCEGGRGVKTADQRGREKYRSNKPINSGWGVGTGSAVFRVLRYINENVQILKMGVYCLRLLKFSHYPTLPYTLANPHCQLLVSVCEETLIEMFIWDFSWSGDCSQCNVVWIQESFNSLWYSLIKTSVGLVTVVSVMLCEYRFNLIHYDINL